MYIYLPIYLSIYLSIYLTWTLAWLTLCIIAQHRDFSVLHSPHTGFGGGGRCAAHLTVDTTSPNVRILSQNVRKTHLNKSLISPI